MALRLHEVHPSLVHFPLALLPASLVLDLVGRASGNRALMEVGRVLMPATVASGVVAGISGLVAQEAAAADMRAHRTLVTHRNMNAAMLGAVGGLATWRMSRERPGWGYLLTGFAAFAAMNYTAYLGGKMVYTHGVGVQAAGGVSDMQSPELRRGDFTGNLRLAGRHLVRAIARLARDLSRGEVAPLLRGRTMQEEPPKPVPTLRAAGTEAEERARYGMTGYGGTQGGYGSSFYPHGERSEDRP